MPPAHMWLELDAAHCAVSACAIVSFRERLELASSHVDTDPTIPKKLG